MGEPLMMTNENLILLHQNFADAHEAISTLGELARRQGLVDETYLPAILEREENFPPGWSFRSISPSRTSIQVSRARS